VPAVQYEFQPAQGGPQHEPSCLSALVIAISSAVVLAAVWHRQVKDSKMAAAAEKAALDDLAAFQLGNSLNDQAERMSVEFRHPAVGGHARAYIKRDGMDPQSETALQTLGRLVGNQAVLKTNSLQPLLNGMNGLARTRSLVFGRNQAVRT
jgi:hypothetical protein